MFYINTRTLPPSPAESQLLKILALSPEQRTEDDHRAIYSFFRDNQFLVEVQRYKSLNARVVCTSQICLAKHDSFDASQHIAIYRFAQETAILSKAVKDQAWEDGEQHIKKMMSVFGSLPILMQLKYDERLYLARKAKQVVSKYNDPVYCQGSTADSFYLVVDGSFLYFKTQTDLPKKLKKIEHMSLHLPPLKPAPLGAVEGFGQIFGLEEYFQGAPKRAYTVNCESAINSSIKINYDTVRVIFQALPLFESWLQKRVKQAQASRLHLIERNQHTKETMQEYLFSPIPIIDHSFAVTVPKKREILNDYDNLKVKAFSNIANRGSNRRGKQVSQQSEETFGVEATEVLKQRFNSLADRQPGEDFMKKSVQLPKILQPIEIYMPKNISVSIKQNGKLIDSNNMVREKEYVMSKKVSNRTRLYLFPPEPIRKRDEFHQKQHKELRTSVSHSEHYMQRMLMGALKKTGYEDQTQEKSLTKKHSKPPLTSLAVKESKEKDFLASSAFDECYFSKI